MRNSVAVESVAGCLNVVPMWDGPPLTLEQSRSVAFAVLEQQGLVLRWSGPSDAGNGAFQAFLLGGSFDAGVSVKRGRVELYPADGTCSVWGNRQWSRCLAFAVLRQQVDELRVGISEIGQRMVRGELNDRLSAFERVLESVVDS